MCIHFTTHVLLWFYSFTINIYCSCQKICTKYFTELSKTFVGIWKNSNNKQFPRYFNKLKQSLRNKLFQLPVQFSKTKSLEVDTEIPETRFIVYRPRVATKIYKTRLVVYKPVAPQLSFILVLLFSLQHMKLDLLFIVHE